MALSPVPGAQVGPTLRLREHVETLSRANTSFTHIPSDSYPPPRHPPGLSTGVSALQRRVRGRGPCGAWTQADTHVDRSLPFWVP